MESFWATLKCEMYLNQFLSYEELVAAVEEYISFYSKKRCQAKYEGLAPPQARNQARAAKLFLIFVCPLDRGQFRLPGALKKDKFNC